MVSSCGPASLQPASTVSFAGPKDLTTAATGPAAEAARQPQQRVLTAVSLSFATLPRPGLVALAIRSLGPTETGADRAFSVAGPRDDTGDGSHSSVQPMFSLRVPPSTGKLRMCIRIC